MKKQTVYYERELTYDHEVMNRFLIAISSILLFVICSCKKDLPYRNYTISGRLLESSSNPVPIKNYKFEISQPDDYGLYGGVSGIKKEFQTDANGAFLISYTPEKSYGLFSSGGVNTFPLSIAGIDTNMYKELYPAWYPITSNKDTALNTIFLFKKIGKFVRKVQLNVALSNNDSLEVITSTAYQSSYKTIYGPIPAGTLLMLDTINEFKVERFNITSGNYFATSVLKKPSYQSNFSLILPIGDEAYREQLLVYP